MKKSVILDIFNGFRGHKETMNRPKGAIKEKMQKVCDAHDELKEKLSPEFLNLHQKFVDALECNWSDELDFYSRSKNACLQGHFCDTDKGLIPRSFAAEQIFQNQRF